MPRPTLAEEGNELRDTAIILIAESKKIIERSKETIREARKRHSESLARSDKGGAAD